MQDSKENQKAQLGHFGCLYKVLCQEKQVKPLLAVQAYLKEECLRFCVDRVNLKDWSPLLNSIADNRSLSKVYIYSRSRCKKIREKINTEEKLENLWRCGGIERNWPIFYSNFLLRCVIDSVAVFARDSSSVTSIALDGIPLAPKYLNIFCSGLRINWSLKQLSLAKCHIGDVGCSLLLDSLRNTPSLCALNLSSCRLTNRSAMSLSLFLKRRKADLLQNIWEECSLQSREACSDKKPQGVHTLILNKNPKFGDVGIRQMVSTLKSDMWLKSMSLRRCGITKAGAEILIQVLGSNSVIMNMDLTENHIPIHIFESILRALRRRREMAETKSKKMRFILNWRDDPLIKISKKTGMRAVVFRRPKGMTNPTKRVNGNLLQACQLKESVKEEKLQQIKDVQVSNKEDSSERKKRLCDLESQLLNVMCSNFTLKKGLSSNKELIDMEIEQKTRTEGEIQKVSLQADDLRSKVMMLNCLGSNVSAKSLLQKGLQDVFQKFQVFSNPTSMDDGDQSYEEMIVKDTELETITLQ